MTKAIIFDTGTLISFSMNGLYQVIRDLKGIFKGKFIITNDVKRELIDRPLTIKRFELEALRLQKLLNDKILELPDSVGVNNSEIKILADEVLEKANKTFSGKRGAIKILHLGEASILALSRILSKKGIENVIAVDERTLRMLGEKPENIEKLLERKMKIDVRGKKENFKYFQGGKFIRSSELLYVAWKKGLFKLDGEKDMKVLDALLYAVKFKGASISGDEIREMKGLAGK
ncbi:MAG: hypothetical protein ACE5ES_02705 [Candidatus Nanoarchaeia archaeon]